MACAASKARRCASDEALAALARGLRTRKVFSARRGAVIEAAAASQVVPRAVDDCGSRSQRGRRAHAHAQRCGCVGGGAEGRWCERVPSSVRWRERSECARRGAPRSPSTLPAAAPPNTPFHASFWPRAPSARHCESRACQKRPLGRSCFTRVLAKPARPARRTHVYGRENAANSRERDAVAAHHSSGGKQRRERLALQHLGHILLQAARVSDCGAQSSRARSQSHGRRARRDAHRPGGRNRAHHCTHHC